MMVIGADQWKMEEERVFLLIGEGEGEGDHHSSISSSPDYRIGAKSKCRKIAYFVSQIHGRCEKKRFFGTERTKFIPVP